MLAGEAEWKEWGDSFEQLLEKLNFVSAVTNHVPEDRSDFEIITYVNVGGVVEIIKGRY